jgi:hypothetical protein
MIAEFQANYGKIIEPIVMLQDQIIEIAIIYIRLFPLTSSLSSAIIIVSN